MHAGNQSSCADSSPGAAAANVIGPGPAGLSLDIAEKSFEELDKDNDGKLTEKERSRGPFMTEKRFNSINTNANGSIGQFEYREFRSHMHEKASSEQ